MTAALSAYERVGRFSKLLTAELPEYSAGTYECPKGRAKGFAVSHSDPSIGSSFFPSRGRSSFLQQPTTSEHTKADARHVQTQGTNRGGAGAAFSA